VRKVLLAVGLLALAVGCGTQEKSSAPAPPTARLSAFAAAVEKGSDAGSVRFSTDTTLTTGGRTVHVPGSGVFDYEQNRGRFSFDSSSLREINPNAKAAGRTQIIFDETVMYMRVDPMTPPLPTGKSWLKVDLRRAGLSAAQIGQESGFPDPAESLLYLRAASGKITSLGRTEVRGVATTHYRAQVDARKFEQLRAERASQSSRAEGGGVKDFPMDVWIDDKGLPRRIMARFVFRPGGAPVRLSTRTDMFDFGGEVDVRTPNAAEAVDITDSFAEGR
jgi:hypothetical protein